MKTPSLSRQAISLLLVSRFALLGIFTPLPAPASPGVSTAVTVAQTYDGNGNVTIRTDGNGRVTNYTYDVRNRLTAVDYPGGSSPDVTFIYDQNGNRTRMTDATGTTTYDYDLFDRLIGIDYPDGGFVVYGYDKAGNVTDLLYGNYTTLVTQGLYTYIQYTYDADNRIATVKSVFTNHTTSYTYDDAGNVSRRTLPNGVYCDYTYDIDGRLTGVIHRKSDNSLIVGFSYALNAIGNRMSMTETLPSGSPRVTSYSYDPLDRLDTVTYPDGRFVNYDYDSFGNRTRLTETIGGTTTVRDYVYDSDSRLLSTTKNSAPEEKFYYDATGNLLQRTRVTDNRQINYVYDFENRLVRYFDGTNNVEYLYNGAGERIAKSVNGIRTNFINDPNRQYVQVLAETDTAGVASRVYEWGNELLNQEDITGTTRNYYLHDSQMGSVRRLVDSGAAVVNSYEYDAFGKPTTKAEGIANDYQFHGECQEEETSLAFLRARFADTESGRFLTRDPVSGYLTNPQTVQPYASFGNDPINARDPSGRDYIDGNGRTRPGSRTSAASDWRSQTFYSGPSMSDRLGAVWNYNAGISASYLDRLNSTPNTFKWLEHAEIRGNVEPNSSYLSTGVQLASALDAGRRYGHSLVNPYGSWFEASAGGWRSISSLSQRGALSSSLGRPGGVALNKSASVLLDINTIAGGTYDEATGQILLFGKADSSPTALPKMSLDDLAVAFRAVQQGSMPVVSIEDPVVQSPPEWPGRTCFTVRYGPFYTDPADGQRKVLDLSSKTHFGWVMFDADRHMKCLGLGVDNRDPNNPNKLVRSSVPGYKNSLDLMLQFPGPTQVTTRYWFNPKIIEIVPSADGKSMELKRAEMQLSTETMFSSGGQVETTPDAEYFANWFTNNYDAIANEQITYDAQNQPHYIFKELKQLAAIVGIVKWIQENNIPVDLSFLKNYTPAYFPEAMAYTPQTTVSKTQTGGGWTRTVTITGGVNYCNDLVIGSGGNPSGLAATALNTRNGENRLAWSFNDGGPSGGQNYNVSAVSVDRKEKDGAWSRSDVDARLAVQGGMPLVLGRHFDSFDVGRSMFGYGWTAQPYALQFKGEPTGFDLCGRTWDGYAEVNFNDRAGEQSFKFVASGMYNNTADPLGIASRFDPTREIVVYRYETKGAPGLLFTDSKTRYTMRLENGTLLDFDLTGNLTRVEDRNGNQINYSYDGSKRLASISQAGVRTISFTYDAQNRVSSAALPDSHSVTYLYDAGSNLVSAQADAPNGRKLTYAYNADHAITEVRDEAGTAVETLTYDVYGRVVAVNQPGVATPVTRAFNLASRTSSATGPNGLSQAMAFNANYDPTTITDARSNSDNLTYNRYREVITERKADQRTYQYYYDSTGRRMATVHPNGRADITSFDVNGNPTTQFHGPSDASFAAQFDVEHVLTGTSLDAYAVDNTSYTYDAKGNLTRIADANAHERNFNYDQQGNRTYARDGRGKQTDFTHDSFSRLTRVKNQLNHQANLAYDERDNVISMTTPLTLGAGGVACSYNLKNQRTSVTTGNAGARHTTNYSYNARGQIATVTDPAGFVTAYSYDARGNLTQITHNNVVRFTYNYDGLNRLTATHYTGTAGGGDPAIVPLNPRGAESLSGSITITWQTVGDWTGNTSVTIQYSTNGATWTTIATVNNGLGSYVWVTGNLASTAVQIRFIRSGDAGFHTAVTAPLRVLNGGKFYVNDSSTAGDQYCTAAGQTYNGTTITGLSTANPVNSIQAIIANYALIPGDTIYVDTGNYPIAADIVITENDAGTVTKPVTITGPTNGGAAVVTHQNNASSIACIRIMDTGTPGKNATGIIVEHLRVTGAKCGILLLDAQECTVRYNECYGNASGGAVGTDGLGNGILVSGGSRNTLDHNTCHGNTGTGGGGGGGSNGGNGIGTGIAIYGSSENRIRFNVCYDNSGIGGAAGSALAKPGDSAGCGIIIDGESTPAFGNQVTDNTCYENNGYGRNELQAAGGAALAVGIALYRTDSSNIERNSVHDNRAFGGNSGNGFDGGDGGEALAYGIYGFEETGLVVTKNQSYLNIALAGYGGADLGDAIGAGSAAGIGIGNCEGTLIKNNLCYYNIGETWEAIGFETFGVILSSGIQVGASPNSLLLNNTLIDNSGYLQPFGGTTYVDYVSAEVFVSDGSTQLTIKNNIFDAVADDSAALWVEQGNTAGTISNTNAFYLSGTAFAGYWGASYCANLPAWKATSSQDAASVNVNPKYYSTATNNFHLSSISPLIDVGETLAQVEEDADGESRPADGPDPDLIARQDIGYDEFIDSDGDTLPDIIEQTVTLTRTDEVDSDSDGLPDGWEVANALNPNSATGDNGASGNPDGDAYTNMQEYLGGSNPMLGISIPAQPPVIASFVPAGENLFIAEEDSIAFSATATDANSDPISYSWRLDSVVKSTTNTWTFTTNSESSGATTLLKSYQVELRVAAGADTVSRQWTVVVSNLNHAPVLATMANLTVNAGSNITLNPSVSDPDNQNNVTGDDNTLTVQYSGFMTGPTKTVTAADAGQHTVTISVRDNGAPVLSKEQSIQIRVFADSDGDGIPDDIELANGFNPNAPADALLDTDGDGMSNIKEYTADTNPRDPLSVLRITSVGKIGNLMLVHFTTSSIKRYRLERTYNLASGIWETVQDNLQGTGNESLALYTNSTGAPKVYFRIVVLP